MNQSNNNLMCSKAGFTLIEMMVVIGIITIISAVAIPNMIAWRNNSQFSASLRQIKSAIDGARMVAIKSNTTVTLHFYDSGDTFCERWNTTTNTCTIPEAQLQAGVIVQNSNFVSDNLNFNSRGMSNAGTLIIEGQGGITNRIIVDVVGTSRIQ